MPEAHLRVQPKTAADWRRLWSFTVDPFRTGRRRTREVMIGDVGVGGANPLRVQSMTIADTLETAAVVDEIEALVEAGSEIVRVTAPNRKHAENLANIKAELRRRRIAVPLVADIHFTPQAALIASEHVEKVRINPGNYADRKHFKKWEYTDAEYAFELERLEEAFRPLVLRCKELGVAMRIGTNHGSLSDRILNRYGDTPLGMVESALEFVRICEHNGYRDIVLSMKASDVKVMVEAYRLLAQRMYEVEMDYPFHLGVTEAGSGVSARVKSAIGITSLLQDGIGDTVRVSLTEDSVHEIPVAQTICAPFQPDAMEPGKPVAHSPVTVVPPWDPYVFMRRPVISLGVEQSRLAQHQPPRIELIVAPGMEEASPEWDRAALQRQIAPQTDAGADLVLLQLPAECSADQVPALAKIAAETTTRDGNVAAAIAVEVAAQVLDRTDLSTEIEASPWSRLSIRLTADDLAAHCPPAAAYLRRTTIPVQYTLVCPEHPQRLAELAAALAEHLREKRLPPGAVALDCSATAFSNTHLVRRFLACWPSSAPVLPMVLREPELESRQTPSDPMISGRELTLAADLGALLVDGVGDAVQLHAGPEPERQLALAREILQSTRLRLSQADFIACPSCGRTQFDLQSTTARIQQRFRHLKGLKIAVMGCIVNGPGEMADADFGYVGSGPGRIDLYVGQERVLRNLSENEAVERLIDLIRRHGRWVEPGPA